MAKPTKPKQMVQRIFRVAQLLAQSERSKQWVPPSTSSADNAADGEPTKS